MTYVAETRADTRKTKEITHTNEMKILRTIVGCSLRDEIQNVVRWTRQRLRDWKTHVRSHGKRRIAKVARDGKPTQSQRSPNSDVSFVPLSAA